MPSENSANINDSNIFHPQINLALVCGSALLSVAWKIPCRWFSSLVFIIVLPRYYYSHFDWCCCYRFALFHFGQLKQYFFRIFLIKVTQLQPKIFNPNSVYMISMYNRTISKLINWWNVLIIVSLICLVVVLAAVYGWNATLCSQHHPVSIWINLSVDITISIARNRWIGQNVHSMRLLIEYFH